MPRLSRFAPALALCLTCSALPVVAEEPRYNQVSLRSEVSQEVAHDRMHVSLYTEEQGSNPTKLASTITATLNKAVKQARQASGVTVSLGNRSSHPVYDDKGQKIRAWRERGELRLESSDFTALSQLTGELLQTLSMGGMNFSISSDLRKQHEDALLKQAVQAFGERARLTSEALGGTGYKLVNLNLNSSGFQQPVLYRSAAKVSMMEAADAAPQIEAGSSRISVNADGMIEVQMP